MQLSPLNHQSSKSLKIYPLLNGCSNGSLKDTNYYIFVIYFKIWTKIEFTLPNRNLQVFYAKSFLRLMFCIPEQISPKSNLSFQLWSEKQPKVVCFFVCIWDKITEINPENLNWRTSVALKINALETYRRERHRVPFSSSLSIIDNFFSLVALLDGVAPFMKCHFLFQNWNLDPTIVDKFAKSS